MNDLKAIEVVIQHIKHLRKILEDGTKMDKTWSGKRLHKSRKVRHGQNREKDNRQRE